MTTKEILIAARKLIEKPENWCQGGFGFIKDEQDKVIKRCGLVAVASAVNSSEKAFSETAKLFEAVVGVGLAVFNDTHTHAEVLKAFDKAIAMAE